MGPGTLDRNWHLRTAIYEYVRIRVATRSKWMVLASEDQGDVEAELVARLQIERFFRAACDNT